MPHVAGSELNTRDEHLLLKPPKETSEGVAKDDSSKPHNIIIIAYNRVSS
jgi:hypothetical protein